MKIPKRIKVGGHYIAIKYPFHFQESNQLGQADYTNRILFLADKFHGDPCCESEIAETFLHEILHHLYSVYVGIQPEETQLERLSQGLFQVLRDNDLDFRRK